MSILLSAGIALTVLVFGLVSLLHLCREQLDRLDAWWNTRQLKQAELDEYQAAIEETLI